MDTAIAERYVQGAMDASAPLGERETRLDGTPVQAPELSLDANLSLAKPTFAIVTTHAEFQAIEADWTDLFERAGTGLQVFQSYGWCWRWLQTYAPRPDSGPTQLAIVTARRAGRLIAVLPFVVNRSGGLARLMFLGEPVSQYGDVLAEAGAISDGTLAAAWAYALTRTRADVAILRKVRADAAISSFLGQLGSTITATEQAPYCDLSKVADYDALELRVSSKLRKNWRRQMRRLEERGPMQSQHLVHGKPAGDAAYLSMVLKRGWLSSKGLLSRAVSDPRFAQFFERAAAGAGQSAGVSVHTLETAGELAAASVAVSAHERRTLHVVVYNQKFEKAGAGSVNLAQTLKKAKEDGVEIFDFLAPSHPYKMEWADGVVDVNDHAMPVTLKGRGYTRLWLGGVREGLKRAVKRMPKGVAQALGKVK